MSKVSIRKVDTPPPVPANSAGGQPPVPVVQRPKPSEPRSAKSVWVVRLVLLCAVFASAALVYWSYTKRFQPVTAEQREKTAQLTRLADEIEQLRFKWGPQQIEQTKTEYSQAKAVLFTDDEEINAWKKRVHAEANMRVLELKQDAAEPVPHPSLTNEVALLPVTLEIRPLPILVTTNTPYSRIVHFADGIAASAEKRFELVSFSVDGNSNSVAQAVAVVNLFTSVPETP